ncbi:MAG: 3-methyl-2-oxobutanoate dehydrogenase subunit VorB [Defluviitaleaceae bacterium]|nr:3-methyl-2-oxobutanoate dehydrogenase subunit VorB [Defluviitaleaceae bacterium]
MSTKQFTKGNEAIAEAAIRAGCMAYYGYPITPQNELTEYMAKHMQRLGRVFIQTESEITAINAVFGSSVAGFRTMTSSAGTAMALKQECISHMSYMELPGVIVDVMRGGPGLGNILSTQGGYNQSKGGGNGDYNVIVLAPNSVQEAADLTALAFDLAEKYRNPTIVLADGTLAQMIELIEFGPEIDPASLPESEEALTGCHGREPRKVAPKNSAMDLEAHNIRLQRKFHKMADSEQRWESLHTDDAEVVVVVFGTPSRMACEMVYEAREQGIKLGLFRPITIWPFPANALLEAVKSAKAIVVLEHNTGMLTRDVRFFTQGKLPVYYHGRMGGCFIDIDEVFSKIKCILNGNDSEWGALNEQQGLWKTF